MRYRNDPTNRPDIDIYMLRMARLVATRSTCVRRAVGCVLTNGYKHVIATGYNGVARGQEHCFSSPCAGASAASGKNLDQCLAIHAEANALLQCKNVQEIMTCYVTSFPCIGCTKLLMNTSCSKIVYIESYVDGGVDLWPRNKFQLTLKEIGTGTSQRTTDDSTRSGSNVV